MLQAFVVVLREGFEAFLIVAIIFAYLRKTGRSKLIPAVYWGILGSVLASTGLGYCLLQGARQSLWEGIFGLVSAVLVAWFTFVLRSVVASKLKSLLARISRMASTPVSLAELATAISKSPAF